MERVARPTFVEPDLGPSPVRVIGPRTFDLSRQVALMAIVNRTRDSFFDRGRTFAFDAALAAVRDAAAAGADWVDIGGVPFSPLAHRPDEAEELDLVVPLVEAARAAADVVISVDTSRVEVARACVAAGADVVNDTSGLRDPAMAEMVAGTDATLVLVHSLAAPGERLPSPRYGDVVDEVRAFLVATVERALAAGVRADRVVVDPGHDLNKNTHHSLELTRRLGELADLGVPLMAATSNKDFVAETLAGPPGHPGQLLTGTLATLVTTVLAGARVVRVHDVPESAAALAMLSGVLGWTTPEHVRHNV